MVQTVGTWSACHITAVHLHFAIFAVFVWYLPLWNIFPCLNIIHARKGVLRKRQLIHEFQMVNSGESALVDHRCWAS